MSKQPIIELIRQILFKLNECTYASDAWQQAEEELKKLLAERDEAQTIIIELLLGFGTDPMGSTRLGASGILLHGVWGRILGSLGSTLADAHQSSAYKKLKTITSLAEIRESTRKSIDKQKIDFMKNMEKTRKNIIHDLIVDLENLKTSDSSYTKK